MLDGILGLPLRVIAGITRKRHGRHISNRKLEITRVRNVAGDWGFTGDRGRDLCSAERSDFRLRQVSRCALVLCVSFAWGQVMPWAFLLADIGGANTHAISGVRHGFASKAP